jgi:hypothetical protein
MPLDVIAIDVHGFLPRPTRYTQFLTPNARPELLPEAEARHERTLEAVSSRPWLGLRISRSWCIDWLLADPFKEHLSSFEVLPSNFQC